MTNPMNLIVLTVAIAGLGTSATADEPNRVGRLVLVAGGGTGADGAAADRAGLTAPFGVGFDAEGTLFFVEMTGHRLRKIGSDGLVTTVAGTGQVGSGGDDGPAAKAELNGPHSLAVMKNGDVLVADTWNNRVRKIDARTGRITTIAGTGRKGFSGDGGPATRADFGGIYCLALDEAALTLNLADLDNRRVRHIDLATGTVSTVAGNGKRGIPQTATTPLVAAGRSPGRRARRPGQPLHPRAQRPCPPGRGPVGQDPHRGRHREAGRLGRRRRRPASASERPQASLRRRPGERPDRRYGESSDSHLSSG